MRGIYLTATLVGLLLFRECTAAPADPKSEGDGSTAKSPAHENEGEIALVQPVAILMDNGDVVPLPVGAMTEDDHGVHPIEAAGMAYADPYAEYGMYGAYPPPQPYGYAAYPMEPPADGRNLTQRMYGGPGLTYPAAYGVQPVGPIPAMRPPLVNKPIINKPIVNKPILNKPMMVKGGMYKGTMPRPMEVQSYPMPAYEPAPFPIIEQPIYRPPPMPRPPVQPEVQPLYDSRYYSGQRPYHPQLPESIPCPQGMKCSAKSYYVPGPKPAYSKPPMPASKAPKYFKRSAYSASKYQY